MSTKKKRVPVSKLVNRRIADLLSRQFAGEEGRCRRELIDAGWSAEEADGIISKAREKIGGPTE